LRERFAVRGAGTNLKVGGGAHVRREALETFFSAVPLHFFGSIPPSTISRFGERFRGGQYTVRSASVFSCLLFFYSWYVIPCQPFVKVGDVPPSCSMESAPLFAVAELGHYSTL